MISVPTLGSSELCHPLQDNVSGSPCPSPSSEHAQQGLVKVLVRAREQRNTSESHSRENKRGETILSTKAAGSFHLEGSPVSAILPWQ